MELRLLQTFVAVAQLRHFARAADRCNLSQPAVSHQMRLLEETVGARLLNRDRRRVSLTVAGELFLEDARRILASVDRARQRVQGISSGAVGRVRFGATPTMGLYEMPAILERYRASHPQFGLQFTIAPELELLERVLANELDMAMMAGRPVLGELRGREIGRDEFVFVAPPGSRLLKERALKPSAVRDEAWVVREEGSDTRRQLDAWFGRHRFTPSTVLTLPGPDAVKRAVMAGLGIALLSRTAAAEELRTGRLRELALTPKLAPRDVLVVDHAQKHHGAACQAMLRLLGASA